MPIQSVQLYDALEKVAPVSLQARLLYVPGHLAVAGHPSERRLYGTLRKKYYWSQIADNVYMMVAECQSYAAKGTNFCLCKPP